MKSDRRQIARRLARSDGAQVKTTRIQLFSALAIVDATAAPDSRPAGGERRGSRGQVASKIEGCSSHCGGSDLVMLGSQMRLAALVRGFVLARRAPELLSNVPAVGLGRIPMYRRRARREQVLVLAAGRQGFERLDRHFRT